MMRTLAWLLLLAASSGWAATSSPDADRCRARGSVEACYDAIRRNPSDPVLLTSLGDAFARENRPVDALRTYRRAAALAPSDRGITAKIAALESKASPKRVAAPAAARTADQSATRRYSNAAPESQSH